MTIDNAEHMQDQFNSILGVLINYTPKAQKYIEAKNKFLDNAKNFYKGREKIIEGFKNGIFLLNRYNEFEEEPQTSKKSDKLKLPKWVKVSEKRFNEIQNTK